MKLFVGFDIRNNNIVLLSAERASDAAHTEYLHFSSRIFTDEFFAEAEKLLEEYFAHKPSLRNRAAYVVLPNEAVSFETFNLPNMSRAKTDLAFDAELNNLYEGRQKNRKINRFVLAQNKQFTTFGAVFFDKKLVAAIYKLLTDVRLFPKETTYRGSALLNCAYNFAPRLRGKSFVFADMHLDYTEIAVSGKGRLLGAATIPHGTSILKTDKVVSEYMATDHEVGELAVINAREAARAKALTLSLDDPSVIPEGATIEDYAVGAEREGEYSGAALAARADAAVSARVGEETEDADGADAAQTMPDEEEGSKATPDGATPDGSADPDAETDKTDETEGTDADDAFRTNPVKKIKVYRKMPKRYPKFMTREVPETAEGILYENWRIVMKWILLYARQAALTEYIPSPEFIVVNLPSEFRALLDKANEEQGEGLKFRPFAAADKMSAEVRANLDLYGCLFAGHFNKNHNF